MYYLIGASQEPHEVNRYHQNLKMEMLCLPISFQKISPRWLMTIASLIVSRKDAWNHISKESSHLQSQSCTVLRQSSRVSKPAHWTHREGWPPKEVRLDAGGGGRCRAGHGKTPDRGHKSCHNPGHWMSLLLGPRGGADNLWTLQISGFLCPCPRPLPFPLLLVEPNFYQVALAESSILICEVGLVIPILLIQIASQSTWQTLGKYEDFIITDFFYSYNHRI